MKVLHARSLQDNVACTFPSKTVYYTQQNIVTPTKVVVMLLRTKTNTACGRFSTRTFILYSLTYYM